MFIFHNISHESSNPGSTHFWSPTEFQSTSGCGLSQPRLQSGLGVFTLEANQGWNPRVNGTIATRCC